MNFLAHSLSVFHILVAFLHQKAQFLWRSCNFPFLLSLKWWGSLVAWLVKNPGSSTGKESTCNAGVPGLFPGSGRSTEEGIGYPLKYSWASVVA